MLSIGLGISPSLFSRVGGAAAVPVVFVPTNGTLKHANVVLSGGNLTEIGSVGDGNYQLVGANASKINKRQFEMTMVTFVAATGHTLGICDSATVNFGLDIVTPGATITSGCVLTLNGSGTYTIHKNGVNTGGGALTTVAGDVISCVYDTAGTVAFYQTHSGVTTQIDITQTAVGMTGWGDVTAFAGGQTNAQNTANFAGPMTRALDAGFSVYGA